MEVRSVESDEKRYKKCSFKGERFASPLILVRSHLEFIDSDRGARIDVRSKKRLDVAFEFE